MEDAEQLLNDGFLRIFKNVRSFNNRGSFEGWMKKIIVNVCLDYLRSKQLKNALQISYKGTINDDNHSTFQTDAVHTLEFKELLRIIQTLPAITKTVFNLYVFEGYSHKEIAAMLEMTESTSSWHLHHARSSLKKKIRSINAEQTLYEQKRV